MVQLICVLECRPRIIESPRRRSSLLFMQHCLQSLVFQHRLMTEAARQNKTRLGLTALGRGPFVVRVSYLDHQIYAGPHAWSDLPFPWEMEAMVNIQTRSKLLLHELSVVPNRCSLWLTAGITIVDMKPVSRTSIWTGTKLHRFP